MLARRFTQHPSLSPGAQGGVGRDVEEGEEKNKRSQRRASLPVPTLPPVTASPFPSCLFPSLPSPCLICLQWKKHWFVLTDSSLRYYRDSNAEEVSMASLSPALLSFLAREERSVALA